MDELTRAEDDCLPIPLALVRRAEFVAELFHALALIFFLLPPVGRLVALSEARLGAPIPVLERLNFCAFVALGLAGLESVALLRPGTQDDGTC